MRLECEHTSDLTKSSGVQYSGGEGGGVQREREREVTSHEVLAGSREGQRFRLREFSTTNEDTIM